MTKIDTLRDKTYKEACKILKVYGKCAIIRPTGFGKTGILTRFIKDGNYKNIVYLYPADIIRTAVLRFYYGEDIPEDEEIKGGNILNLYETCSYGRKRNKRSWKGRPYYRG